MSNREPCPVFFNGVIIIFDNMFNMSFFKLMKLLRLINLSINLFGD